MDQRDPIMQYFDDMRDNALMPAVKALAEAIHDHAPRNPERTVALRKLLECRDSLIRAVDAK